MLKRLNDKGVTLVALVVTIIILIILATISLNLLLGENGLLDKVRLAKQNYEDSKEDELNQLDNMYSKLLVATDGTVTVDYDTLQNYVEQKVNAKTSALETRLAATESKITSLQQNTIRYVDYTRVLDNTSLKSQNASYTATEDCAIIGVLKGFDNFGVPLYVDDIAVSSICNQAATSDKFTAIAVCVFVKKGSVVTTRKDHGTYDLTVYGLQSL